MRSPGTLCERLRQNHKRCWELQIPLLLNISLHLQTRQVYQRQHYYTSWFPEETQQHFFWPPHALGTEIPSLQGTRCRVTWSCIVATALYTPRSVKQERPSGPGEIAHLSKRLSVLSCCIRIAAGCWAIPTAFKWGQQQVQNAKEGISCLSPQKHKELNFTGISLLRGHNRHMLNVVH